MRKVLAIIMLTALGLAAQAPASAKVTKKASARPGKAVAKSTAPTGPTSITIPKDAVARPDGTYSWTDKQGKGWVFYRTPFGVIKSPMSNVQDDSKPLANVRAVDAGDKVRFETTTPFGVIKREKSKTELTDEERTLYNSQNPTHSAKQE